MICAFVGASNQKPGQAPISGFHKIRAQGVEHVRGIISSRTESRPQEAI